MLKRRRCVDHRARINSDCAIRAAGDELTRKPLIFNDAVDQPSTRSQCRVSLPVYRQLLFGGVNPHVLVV